MAEFLPDKRHEHLAYWTSAQSDCLKPFQPNEDAWHRQAVAYDHPTLFSPFRFKPFDR